jgi:periplasmic mercuric ion binding protein
MINIIKILTASIVSVAFLGCNSDVAEAESTGINITESIIDGTENATVALMSIEGMTCEVGCAKFINGRLAKTEGVLSTEIDFDENLAKVSFDSDKTSALKLAEMVNLLNHGQYKVSAVEVQKIRKVENSSGSIAPASNSGSSEKELDQIQYESFKSISFPNIFNIFKLKLV